MNLETYQKIPAMNASLIKHGMKSMRHMRYAAMFPLTEPTAAMRWGSIVHAAVLEPDTFADRYAVWSGATRRGKKYDAFCKQAGDREVVTLAEKNDAFTMSQAARENKRAKKLLAGLVAREESITFTLDDLPCKARLDGRGADYIIDLKTAKNISKRAFERSAYDLGYHIQMAWYRFGANKVQDKIHTAHIIAIESEGPFDCIVYDCSNTFLERGMLEADRIVKEYAACCERWEWPGQNADPVALDLPAWAVDKSEVIPDETMEASEL